jgi:hypothetical protein
MTLSSRSAGVGSPIGRRAVLRAIASGLLLAASTAALSACGRGRDSVVAPRPAAPGTLVMIIRHGEKPDGSDKGIGPDGKTDKASLTARGYARAARLADLFAPDGAPGRQGLRRPVRLYAANANDEGEGKRTRETIAPLAARLGLAVNTSFGKGQESELVESVLAGPGPTLICWQHGEIPAIATAFGRVTPTPPSGWPGDRFDVIWTLTASASGWFFAQIPELIMPGDRAKTIKA